MGDRQISSTGGFPPDLGARRSLRAELDARRVELGELDDEEEQRRVDASVLWEAVPGTRTTNYADSARFARFVVNGPHGERCVVHRAHSGVAYPENAGGEVTVCDGCVDLPNLPGRAYDYRVGFTVDWDPAAHWAGQQTPPPKLRVTEVTVAVRDGGPAFSVTDLHGEALGEVVAAAARCLARADDRIDARPSERVARGLVQQRTPVGDPVRIVADAYQAAASGQGGGLGRIALAQARLSAKHHASSASTVHKLARKARAAGLLPEQAAGRPPVRR